MYSEVTIILPLYTNAGKPHHDKVDALIERIVSVTGGATIDEVSGIWTDNGKTYRDASKRVVALVDSNESVAQLKAIARLACEQLQQQAVFFQVRSDVAVDFIEAA